MSNGAVEIEGNICSLSVGLPDTMSHIELENRLAADIGRCTVAPRLLNGKPSRQCTVSVQLDAIGNRTTLDIVETLRGLGCVVA
ncbi:MAG: hypothetical protein PHX87_04575 [Candidatus Peribacteraceae bacterium]|nr:hypothetical protein [Candidatus Peribacteraceae bacterium]MDD5742672.1 hypothetical protein [Candidatus Peribacteraceae bacterium]